MSKVSIGMFHIIISIITIVLFIKEVDLTYIARVTKGFSGADLTEICQRVSSTLNILLLRDIV